MDPKSGQKINKETEELNNAISQIDPTEIYGIPTISEYTFFSSAHGVLQYIVLCDSLRSFTIMFSRFIHVACISTAIFFIAK